MAKRGHFDPDDVGQYRSATPSIQWGTDRSEDGAMFSVPSAESEAKEAAVGRS